MKQRIRLLDMNIDNVTMEEAMDRVGSFVERRSGALVVTPNVDHVMLYQKSHEFRAVYDEADLVLADGVPLMWGARLTGQRLKEKVSGSDLFPLLCARAAEKGWRVFLLGGRPGAAAAAADVLQRRHPRLRVAGTYCPPMGFERDLEANARAIEAVRKAKPDILFVGVGSPKQEYWIRRWRKDLLVPVAIGVGAAFDFLSGQVRRAPVWMQRAGLEWLWRLAQEPKRLWKRYLIDDLPYFYLLLKRMRLSG